MGWMVGHSVCKVFAELLLNNFKFCWEVSNFVVFAHVLKIALQNVEIGNW